MKILIYSKNRKCISNANFFEKVREMQLGLGSFIRREHDYDNSLERLQLNWHDNCTSSYEENLWPLHLFFFIFIKIIYYSTSITKHLSGKKTVQG